MDVNVSYVVWLILSIFSAAFGQQTRDTFILKSTCHTPKRWIYRNNSIVFCDDPNVLACPDKSSCEQIWMEKFACCGFDEERPLFTYPPSEEEDRQSQLKHLIRARPKPKKRIKPIKSDPTQYNYSALPLSGMVRLEGKPVGRGSISKLPIEQLFSSREEPAVDSAFTPPQNQIFYPPVDTFHIEPAFEPESEVELGADDRTEATTVSTTNVPSELLEFTDFVKRLLERKQKWKMNNASRRKLQENSASTITTFIEATTTTSAPFVYATLTTESAIIENGWRVMDREEEDVFKNQDINITSEYDAMKALYKQVRPEKPLYSSKVADESDAQPQIHIIQEGSAEQLDVGQYKLFGSITLIQDQGKNILVDTGLSTDRNGKNRLIAKLVEYGMQPSDVHYVIITHGHPDHSGNANLFPNALHYAGHFAIYQSAFKLTELFERDKMSLNPNIELQKTPGHTSEDISVIVKGTQDYGTVAICGDTFMAKEDIEYADMWQPLAYNEIRQRDSRRKIICQVDNIVPGHGPMFQVTPEMRETFRCDRLV